MTKSYWLMKSEPDSYGWSDLLAQGEGVWDGVKNAQASNYMKAMAVGDEIFFYHSRTGLDIVGIMRVSAAHFPDPKDESGRWVAVKVKPVKPLTRPVTLSAIKVNPALAELPMLRQSRLSVCPVTAAQWAEILAMSGG